MNYFGEKPSSRVLRPPGGSSSNIFGGSDEQTVNKSPKPKPTYQSSIFSSDQEPSKPKSTGRQGSTTNNIFGTDSVNNNVTTSPKKFSKTHQSSIFAESEPAPAQQKTAVLKRDPITGVLDEEENQENGVADIGKENGTGGEPVNEDIADTSPHLGAVKNSSGVRCAQPPGGKSSISFG